MMSYTLFARWFGIVSIVISLGILANLEDAKELAKDLIKSGSGYIVGGVLPVIFGTLAVLQFSTYTFNHQMLIAVIGLIMLVVGALRLWFPSKWKILLHEHLDQLPSLFSLFGLMFGLALCYIGFIAHTIR